MTQELNITSDKNVLPASRRPVDISYEALEKGNTLTVVTFTHTLPLYQVSPLVFFRDCGPILNFLFSVIYVADIQIEAAQRNGDIPFRGIEPGIEKMGEITELLKERDLYDSSVQEMLNQTLRYWELTNKMMYDGIVTHELLTECIDVIPGDTIAGHYICHRILNIPADEAKMKAIHAWEAMINIENQLILYSDAVTENYFNFYRMFIKLYGEEAPQYIEQERTRRIEYLQACIAKLPEREQETFLKIIRSSNQFNYDYYSKTGLIAPPEKTDDLDPRFPYSPVPIPEPILE